MATVNPETPTHILALFDAAFRQLRKELEGRVGDEIDGLRTSQLRLLSMTPAQGARVTDLASRAGMTKQAVGEFVAALQQSGHVEVVADRRDRRARVVRPTARGRRVVERADEEIARFERRCAQQFGQRRWSAFRAVLAELGRG